MGNDRATCPCCGEVLRYDAREERTRRIARGVIRAHLVDDHRVERSQAELLTDAAFRTKTRAWAS